MRKTVLPVAAVVAALTAAGLGDAGSAVAQDRRGGMGMDGMGMERMFERFDADGDGRLTQDEVAAARAARIAALDADGDGVVTRDEAIAFARAEASDRAERRAGAMFDRADADGDGRLTAAEVLAAGGMPLGGMFARMDLDNDGAISGDEARAAHRAFRRGEGRGEGWGGGHLRGHHDGRAEPGRMRDGHGPRHGGN